jgi:hypothetical protein
MPVQLGNSWLSNMAAVVVVTMVEETMVVPVVE